MINYMGRNECAIGAAIFMNTKGIFHTKVVISVIFGIVLQVGMIASDIVIPNIEKWTETQPYPENRPEWVGIETLPFSWEVSCKHDEVCIAIDKQMGLTKITERLPDFDISDLKYPVARIVVFEVFDGWIVGYDAGEWGGKLVWFSTDGKEKYQICYGNVIRVFLHKNCIYVLVGLSHLGVSDGEILIVEKNQNNRWDTTVATDCPSAPVDFFVNASDDLFVLTESHLLKLLDSQNFVCLYKFGLSKRLEKTSLVVRPDGTVLIGARYAIVKLKLEHNSYNETWLIHPNLKTGDCRFTESCHYDELRGFHCTPFEYLAYKYSKLFFDKIEVPIITSNVRGNINTILGLRNLGKATLEIKRPNDERAFQFIEVDSNGGFREESIPPGEYTFKASAFGWRSVLGRVVVDPNNKNLDGIKIILQHIY